MEMKNGSGGYQNMLQSVFKAPPYPTVFLNNAVLVLGFTLCDNTFFYEILHEPVSSS